jgi:hypothetical protein
MAPPQSDVIVDPWGFGAPSKKTKKTKKGLPLELEPEPLFEPEDTLPDWAGTTFTTGDACRSLLEMHAKVFAAAFKYDIRPLEYTARKKLKDQMECNWDVVNLITATHVIFNLTPDSEFELRNILKDTMVRYALPMVQNPGFEEAVASIDGLAYDLFRRKTYATR